MDNAEYTLQVAK